ncbi:MAG: hypothetical protein Q8922_05400 [Bacteroidota bacterium]|nr:hypothetical protein [Bacteroidota bacterium]MDP4233162.1 hypothetical protein [Bacteroidota bacterium]MDP4241693.1 hypothetical protein [Bacteroidota bacterium]MDP4287351.1 hypothetical protein [Bacteroidota bacterium]
MSLNKLILFVLPFALIASSAFGQSSEDSSRPAPSNLQTFLDQTHLGGYGEMTYKRPSVGDVPRLNLPRIVLYIDHDFSDRWVFKSEFEVENVKLERAAGGELGFEQAFLDYHANQHIGWRGGLILIPMGIINQTHEPNTFYSVERPLFDQQVIPTTWREIGTGIYGDITEGVKYQLYLTEGLQAADITMGGLDGGKQEGSAGDATSDLVAGSDASHPALSMKLDYLPLAGLRVGLAGYVQPNAFAEMQPIDTPMAVSRTLGMAILDARYEHGPLHVRGEVGFVHLVDSVVNPGPKYFSGGYFEAAYNVLSLWPNHEAELLPFVRYEHMTAYRRATGSTLILEGDNLVAGAGDIVTSSFVAGIAFKPLDAIIFKIDYRITSIDGKADYKQFSLGGGFAF